jgi:hypothetical protein
MPTEFDLRAATAEIFRPLVGGVFDAVFTDGRLPLTLTEVRTMSTMRPGTECPTFALTFQGAPNLRLPQMIYHLENATLGAVEIFLVQVGADDKVSTFEAVFN